MKYYRDLKNSLDTAKEEGFEEGIEKGIDIGIGKGKEDKAIEIAKEMLSENEPIEKIIRFTGLTLAQIERLIINSYPF